MKDFFGLPLDLQVPAGFIPQWGCYFQNIGNIDWLEFAMSMICLVICFSWTKVTKKVPGSLIALIVGTVASVLLSKFAGVELSTIGSKFPELANGLPMPKPVAPEFDFETIKGLVSPAFTIAILCAIESLLAAMVADGATGKQHHANTELIGQGIANIVTPLFGGIPATGALARTMASINNGGKSPVTGIIHAVVLLLIYLFLMPYAIYIPLSCLAAILVQVAYNMSEWKTFKYLLFSTLAITMSYCTLIELFPCVFIRLFAQDEALIELTVKGLRIYSLGLGIFGLQNAIQSMFVGLGQAKVSLFIAILRKIILLIPLALVLPTFLGVNGVYIAEPIADITSASIATGLMLYHFNRILARREQMLSSQHKGA
jgi:hypothetical protein